MKQETFMKDELGQRRPRGGSQGLQRGLCVREPGSAGAFHQLRLGGFAQTDAAAKGNKERDAYSGAVTVKPGVWVYQITPLRLEPTSSR
jgi:hypothetical protein